MRWLNFLLLIFLFPCITFAQADRFKIEDFRLNGNTVQTGDRCFQLTTAENWAFGALWNKKAISLLDPFTMELELFFGCQDELGADGIVFVFHPYANRQGRRGEGMGFGGLYPSLGIELDTYQNPHLGDPYYDHIALMRDGRTHHYTGLTEPVRVSASSANIEDCKTHKVKVTWDPKYKRLQVYFDGALRVNYQRDIVKTIFENNASVYWGFTAATGQKNNKHSICLEKLKYTESHSFDSRTSKKILNGDNYTLEGVEFTSGRSQLLTNSFEELDKLYSLLRTHPRTTITITGHTDSAGSEATNQRLSQQRADAVRKYLIDRGIDARRLKSLGYGEKYPVAPNTSAEGRSQNRRVTIYMSVHRV